MDSVAAVLGFGRTAICDGAAFDRCAAVRKVFGAAQERYSDRWVGEAREAVEVTYDVYRGKYRRGFEEA